MIQGNQTTAFNVDELREADSRHGRPPKDVRRGATDVRAGSSANGLSEGESSPTTSEGFVIQLDEARKEWKRRKSQPKTTKPNEI
jgi:hypothetical protein